MTIIRLAAVLLLAAPALAQNPPVNVERESQDPSRRSSAEKKAAEAAAAAARAGEEIAFETVLANPGDLDLNERFARQQIAQGDLRGASTTLERILILAPGRDHTRLLYAAVLFRLDAIVDAERELRIILGRLASADVVAEAKRYLELVEGKKRRTHFDARVSVGMGYDDNRNSASDSDRNLFFGVPVLLNRDSRRQEDTNVSFSAALGMSREFGGAKPKKFFSGVSYYRGEQTLVDALDLQAYGVNGGFVLPLLGLELVPAAGFDHVLLNQESFLRNVSASLRVSRKVRPRVLVWGELRRDDQQFLRTRLVPSSKDRDGDQFDFSAGVQWVATPRDRLGFTAGHRRKVARNAVLGFRREWAGIDYTRLLGRGMFLAAGLGGQFDRYDRIDPTTAPFGRADDAMTVSLLYGAPLDLLWAPLKGFSGTLGWERFQQTSNIVNFDYSNNRLTALVSYKWGI